MRNILVVNVNWLGDVIFSSPIFKALKNAYPESRITCLAHKRVTPILEHIENIDEIITLDEDKEHKSIFKKIKFIYELRHKKFDIAFLLHRSLTRALYLFLAGIPQRVGYDEKNRGIFLTHKVKNSGLPQHRSDKYINVIETFGVKVTDRVTRLNCTDSTSLDKLLVNNGIKKDKKIIVINPGGNWDLKRWPEERWIKLTSFLSQKKDYRIVVSGSSKDIELAEKIACEYKDVITLAGKTDFDVLIALMKKAELLISADSGPIHIASSIGTDVIGIFGPTDPKITGPRGFGKVRILRYDVGCNRKACYNLNCTDNICMKAVSVEDVMNAVSEFLK